MAKYLVFSIGVMTLITLLVRVESRATFAPLDLKKMAQDAKDTAKMAIEVMKNFNPETIKIIMKSMKKPEERKGMMQVLLMLVQGKSIDEVIDKVMDLECGIDIAQALEPALEKLTEVYGKYQKLPEALRKITKNKGV